MNERIINDAVRHRYVIADEAEELGYLTAFAAQALIDGTITGAEGDTFEAGSLGSYTVGADSVVLLGEPYRFNADNISDFDF